VKAANSATLHRQRTGSFALESLACVMQGGVDIVADHTRVVTEDRGVGPAFGQELEEELGGDSRPRDHGLVRQGRRIDLDPVLPHIAGARVHTS
jgi:hypothetical protein